MAPLSQAEITKLIGLHLGKRSLNASDRLVEDLGAESADVANIVAAVEEKYGITIKETEIARLFTPQDLYDLVKQLIR